MDHFRLFDAENVGTSKTLIQRVPVGDFTYYQLVGVYKDGGVDAPVADMRTDITKIEILVDGRPQWTLSADQLFAVNEHHGNAPKPGRLPLNFALLKDYTGTINGADVADALAWGTLDVSTITIKVDLGAGAAAPSIQFHAFGLPVARPMGKILQYVQADIKPETANAFHRVKSFEDQADRPIVAAYLKSADVTSFEYQVGRTSKFEEIEPELLDDLYDERLNLASVSGYAILDFALTGRPDRDAQPLVVDGVPQINQTFSIKASATTNIETLLELIGERG